MAFTMHSHSGQFCPGHAVDQLQDIIDHAISLGYKTIGLTEHMPRPFRQDLYPEELLPPPPSSFSSSSCTTTSNDNDKETAAAEASIAAMPLLHESYLLEATRLQTLYKNAIQIIIGFEAEFIRPEYHSLVTALCQDSRVDYFIGSVHHVHSIPIDYNKEMYSKAISLSSKGNLAGLFEDYYDLQYDMLLALKPRIVGHFDLIKLLADCSEATYNPASLGGGRVWEKILRNLKLVKSQGGWLECNTSALRKGLEEPYPGRAIAKEWVGMGGSFTMSDDSHGIAQVATNYARAIGFLESLGVEEVWTLKRTVKVEGERAVLEEVGVSLQEFRKSFPAV